MNQRYGAKCELDRLYRHKTVNFESRPLRFRSENAYSQRPAYETDFTQYILRNRVSTVIPTLRPSDNTQYFEENVKPNVLPPMTLLREQGERKPQAIANEF